MSKCYYSLHVPTGTITTHEWTALGWYDNVPEVEQYRMLNEWNRLAMIGPDSDPKPFYHYWM